jgi:hypothetical protein
VSDEQATKNWFLTLPGLLTAVAALLTALAGLITVIFNLTHREPKPPVIPGAGECLPGYEWRLAIPEDHICVTKETHLRTAQDNQLAGSRRNPAGGHVGLDTCLSGFVWREAFAGDHVCVEPAIREQAWKDNGEATLRVRH